MTTKNEYKEIAMAEYVMTLREMHQEEYDSYLDIYGKVATNRSDMVNKELRMALHEAEIDLLKLRLQNRSGAEYASFNAELESKLDYEIRYYEDEFKVKYGQS